MAVGRDGAEMSSSVFPVYYRAIAPLRNCARPLHGHWARQREDEIVCFPHVLPRRRAPTDGMSF